MKIALVHDYLSQDGGAERVLRSLQRLYPEAPTFVLFHDRAKAHEAFQDRQIRESFLKWLPGGRSHYRWYLPLMPLATEKHNLSGFEVVLSSSSAFSKGIVTSPQTLHLCYCHTPTRFLWTDSQSYLDELDANPLIKFFLPPLLSRLRLWDQLSANRVDQFIANSETVARRIQKFYRRESEVIYPPVATDSFRISEQLADYYLTGGRLVSYKRYDLVIKVFNRLGWPLKIFGTGPLEDQLRALARPNIEFLGKVTDEEKAALYSRALAFIHPQVEDFGITAVESMAAGRPVIALPQGGAGETVIEGVTGKFFAEQTWESLLDTMLNFNPRAYDPYQIREQAQNFSVDKFNERLTRFVSDQWENFQKGYRQNRLFA